MCFYNSSQIEEMIKKLLAERMKKIGTIGTLENAAKLDQTEINLLYYSLDL